MRYQSVLNNPDKHIFSSQHLDNRLIKQALMALSGPGPVASDSLRRVCLFRARGGQSNQGLLDASIWLSSRFRARPFGEVRWVLSKPVKRAVTLLSDFLFLAKQQLPHANAIHQTSTTDKFVHFSFFLSPKGNADAEVHRLTCIRFAFYVYFFTQRLIAKDA